MEIFIISKAISIIENRVKINNIHISANDNYIIQEGFEKFNTPNIPELTLFNYIVYVLDKTKSCGSTFIYSLILLIKIDNNLHCLSISNCYTLLYTCFYISYKLNEDKTIEYSDFCDIGGIGKRKLWFLEHLILAYLDFNILINIDEFQIFYSTYIVEYIPNEGNIQNIINNN